MPKSSSLISVQLSDAVRSKLQERNSYNGQTIAWYVESSSNQVAWYVEDPAVAWYTESDK